MSNEKAGHWTWAFVDQRRSWLLNEARGMCRNHADADDLVQEVGVRFFLNYQQMEACSDARSCEAWLVRVLSNLFVDQCRRKKVQAQVPIDTESHHGALVAPEPDVPPAYASVSDEQFAQVLDKLGPKGRAAFEMYAAGKKYHEIAAVLGIRVGTVGKRLHDVRAKLRQLLQSDTRPESP